MTKPEISVIIPTHNKARYLDLALASWCSQTFGSYELVIVDDGSTDDTTEVLRRYHGQLPIAGMRIPHQGRAAARNRGLTLAQGSRIVFVDDDRIVSPKFLGAHREGREANEVVIGWQHGLMVDIQNHGDQTIPPEKVARLLRERPDRVATVLAGSATMLLSAEDLRKEAFDLDALRLEDPWEPYLERMIRAYGEDLSACPLAWACGTTGNMSTSRALLQEIGGFDERFAGWGIEDTELHYRLARAGARIRVAREACNYHQNHPKDVASRRGDWGRNAKAFLTKHETLEVALYIHAETGNIPHLNACEILSEARQLGECATTSLLGRLTINSAYDIVSHWGAL